MRITVVSSITTIMIIIGARSAGADPRLCTSSGINTIVPLSFHSTVIRPIYIAHISSSCLELLMAPYIIFSLVTGPVH